MEKIEFSSIPTDEEKLTELREKEQKSELHSLDLMNISKLKKDREYYSSGKSFLPEEIQKERAQEIAHHNYDKFLRTERHVSPKDSIHFWGIAYDKQDPVIAKIKEEAAELYDDDSGRLHYLRREIRIGLEKRTFPIELWLSILEEYKAFLTFHNDHLQKGVPKIKEGIVSRFMSELNPLLDEPKEESELRKILDSIQIKIKDPLATASTEGSHSAALKTIELGLGTLLSGKQGEAFLLVAHEELHALSAGQVMKHTKEAKSESGMSWIENNIHAEWAGLQVNGFDVSRFTWLNEAVTETLAGLLIKTPPTHYKKERQLTELLLTKGKKQIDIKLLYNAYFERRGRQAGEDGPKFWNELRNEIRESFDHDPQFLIKLDILVQKKGINEALILLEEWNPAEPQTLNIKEIEANPDQDTF